jgi:hypothetical protein
LSAIDEFLESTETVAWRGKPAKKTILLQSLAGIPFALIFGSAGIVMLTFDVPLLGLPLGLLVVACCLVMVPPVWFLKKLPNTEYVVTNRRVLIKTGSSKHDVWSSELDKIRGFIVTTGVSDKIVGTGKLYPITAEYPYAPKLRVYTRNGMDRLRKVYNLTTGVYDKIFETELYRKSLSHPHLEGVKNPSEVKRVFDQIIGTTTIAAKYPMQYSIVQKIGLGVGASLLFAGLLVFAWGYLTGYTPYVSYGEGYTLIDHVAIVGYGLTVPGILVLILTVKSILYSRCT